VRARPGARRVEVGGCWDGPGGPALLVAVRARAVEGQANEAVVEAVVEALASAFALRRGEVTIAAGHRGRDKIVELAGEPGALAARLAKLRR
jgi:hypothetical protein